MVVLVLAVWTVVLSIWTASLVDESIRNAVMLVLVAARAPPRTPRQRNG